MMDLVRLLVSLGNLGGIQATESVITLVTLGQRALHGPSRRAGFCLSATQTRQHLQSS